jgi:isopenicillin N synthase-like dioxygenase
MLTLTCSLSLSLSLSVCREVMERYEEEVFQLTERLLDLFCEILGLKAGYLSDVFGEPMMMVRQNFYPPCPRPELVLGLRPHSDPNVMTLLFQDKVAGLQVKNGGRWVSVNPVAGALVVNLGDQMQVSKVQPNRDCCRGRFNCHISCPHYWRYHVKYHWKFYLSAL